MSASTGPLLIKPESNYGSALDGFECVTHHTLVLTGFIRTIEIRIHLLKSGMCDVKTLTRSFRRLYKYFTWEYVLHGEILMTLSPTQLFA